MIKIVVYKLVGISPLLTSNPASMSDKSSTLGKKEILGPKEAAKAGCYMHEEAFALPAVAVRSALMSGCKGKRIGKVGALGLVMAGVFTVEQWCDLLHPATGKPLEAYEILTVRGVNRTTKQGILVSRPLFNPWSLKCPVEVDDDFVTQDQVLQLLNIGGRIAGIGAWRVEKKGVYGRFSASIG